MSERGDTKHVAVAIAESLGLALPAAMREWTDEQWAEHDARIAADRARLGTDPRPPRAQALADNGFPLRALEAAATADMSRSAIARVARWLPKPEGVLVISGGEGVGKTVAAAWWALRLPQVATFVRAASFARSSRYEQDRSALMQASALVLDDLGAEFLDAKGSFLVDLDELIDVYYGNRKPILVTTNCTHEDFKARYGARIAGRIREQGAFFAIGEASMRATKTTKRRST